MCGNDGYFAQMTVREKTEKFLRRVERWESVPVSSEEGE
jgi:hypothetical protein